MAEKHSIKSSPEGLNSAEVLSAFDAKLEQHRNDNLDRKWREKAEKELGEDNEISKDRINQLRHVLSTTNLVPSGRRDDAFFLRFLRAKKFDVEKSFRMMVKYYSMKQQSPQLFKVSPAAELCDLLKMQIQVMLPFRDVTGKKVYIFRVKKCDPYLCPVELVFRSNVLALEHAVREPETQIGGLVVLLDMAGAGLGHAKFLAPNLSKRTVEVIQEAFPLRFKAFHILNEPFYFDAVLAVLKPFLKEKIRRRIFLHGSSLTSLHKYIPKDILPTEYGGDQANFDNTTWRQSLFEDESYFQRLETFTFNSNMDSVLNLQEYDELNANPPECETDCTTSSIPLVDNVFQDENQCELNQDYSDSGGLQKKLYNGSGADFCGNKMGLI